MILWSVVPEETVFAGFGEPGSLPQLQTIERDGVTMVVEWLGPAQARLHRLISPRAIDYLRPEWAPGQMITFT